MDPRRAGLHQVGDPVGPVPPPYRGEKRVPVRVATRRPAPEVYRRRRLVAAGLFLIAAAGVLAAGQVVLSRIGGGPLATTGAGGAVPAADQVYLVKPGDTLWSIATSIDPSGDVRPLVAHLAQETGSPTVYPGERITLP